MPDVELIQLSAEAVAALAEGDLRAANVCAPVPLTAWHVTSDSRGTWVHRRRQLAQHPDDAAWITRVIWDPDRQLAVGQAGFHGPPDEQGMVELGYAVDPEQRGQGYARAAFGVLLERARREPSVQTLRATVSPGNAASEHLVAAFGLVWVGEQWDDEDGLEIVYELAVGA